MNRLGRVYASNMHLMLIWMLLKVVGNDRSFNVENVDHVSTELESIYRKCDFV